MGTTRDFTPRTVLYWRIYLAQQASAPQEPTPAPAPEIPRRTLKEALDTVPGVQFYAAVTLWILGCALAGYGTVAGPATAGVLLTIAMAITMPPRPGVLGGNA